MRRGFTLLEILLALAVIALLATVFIGASSGLMRDRASSPEDVFWKAAQAARKSAVATGQPMQLTYSDKTKSFAIDDGARTRSFPIPNAPRDLEVSFLSSGDGSRSAVLLGGVAVEAGAAPPVIFYGDGTCSPFRVQFVAAGQAKVLTIDPWTCAEVLPKPTT